MSVVKRDVVQAFQSSMATWLKPRIIAYKQLHHGCPQQQHRVLKMAESAIQRHPTGGRRRKTKGPAVQPQLPDLLPLPQGGESSDEKKKMQSG